MDIADLDSNLKFIHHNGVCLNVEERLQLQMGLQKLLNEASDEDFEELLFWGKINGVKNDYYIAMGITYTDKYEFPEKRFYWALSTNYQFCAFPGKNDQHEDHYDKLTGMFSGNPMAVLVKVEDDIVEKNEFDE